MVLFKDLNRPATDLLFKDYPHEKNWEVEVKHCADKDVAFTGQAFSIDKSTNCSAQLRHTAKDLVVDGKIAQSGAWNIDTKFSNEGMKGALLNLRLEQKTKAGADGGQKLAVEVGAEYLHPRFHGRCDFMPMTRLWSMSGVFATVDRLKVGGELSGGMNKSNLSYTLGGSYTSPDGRWFVTGATLPESGQPFAGILGNFHCRNGPAELAAEFRHKLSQNDTRVTFAGKCRLDDNTFVRARVSQNANVSLALAHRLSPMLTATVGGQIDGTSKGDEQSRNFRYGMKINLTQ